ncbi:MAG: FGGY-family carbohydrate kinase [Paracoccaceae bacterium]
MADPRHIAVFDVGKTSCKMVLLNGADFIEIDVLRQENSVLAGPPYPHLDTETMWSFLCESLASFETKYGIDALAITTHGSAAGLVDADGLVLPILDYEYEIPAGIAKEYDGLRPAFEETCSPRMPGGLNLGAQLHFLRSAFPEEYANAVHFLTFPQYWSWRLTGIARSERTSLGAHSDLWLPELGVFSSLVGGVFPKQLFAPIALAGDMAPVNKVAAKATGLKPGTPVTSGIHDSNASLLPWLDAGGALSVVSSGTWTIVMSIGGALDRLDPARDMLANVDARGRPVPTAKFMGGREYEMLTSGAVGEICIADIEAVIANDTCPLPGRVAGVGPFPAGPAGWTGSPPETDRAKIAGATLYLALMSDTCLSLAGTGERVVIEGPFAKNTIYAQLLAALLDCPFHISTDATGTATGAAMLLGSGKPATLGPPVEPLKIPGLRAFRDRWRMLSAG